jgi:hypothetical protein
MQSTVLTGCCVSRYVTFSKSDNNLRDAITQGSFNNGSAVAFAALHPEDNKNYFDAFVEAKIPFEKLGNGQVFFHGTGNDFKNACNMEALRPIIEWEKKEGRKRNEKRVGDIVDLTTWVGAGHEGRVHRILPNGNIICTAHKVSRYSTYRVGALLDNYGTGFAQDFFPIILPTEDNDK